jgi:hypothetical protein
LAVVFGLFFALFFLCLVPLKSPKLSDYLVPSGASVHERFNDKANLRVPCVRASEVLALASLDWRVMNFKLAVPNTDLKRHTAVTVRPHGIGRGGSGFVKQFAKFRAAERIGVSDGFYLFCNHIGVGFALLHRLSTPKQ